MQQALLLLRNQGFLRVDERRDGRGNPYFWIGFEREAMIDPPAEGTDLHALAMRVEDAVCHEVPAARLEIHMDPGTARHRHALVGTPIDGVDDHVDEHHHDDDRGDHDHLD